MKKIIKTLALIATGLVVGVVIGRVRDYKIEQRLKFTSKGFRFKPTLIRRRY